MRIFKKRYILGELKFLILHVSGRPILAIYEAGVDLFTAMEAGD